MCIHERNGQNLIFVPIQKRTKSKAKKKPFRPPSNVKEDTMDIDSIKKNVEVD